MNGVIPLYRTEKGATKSDVLAAELAEHGGTFIPPNQFL